MNLAQVMRHLSSTDILRDGPKPFKKIPGPKAFPLIGTLWKYFPLLGNYDVNRLHVTGFRMLEEYGPIVKENISNGEVIVNAIDPNDIEKIYKSEGKYPARRSHKALAHYRLSRPGLYNTGGLLPTNGSEWWRLRSTFQKSLSRIQEVRSFLTIADKIIGDFLDTYIGEGILIYDFLPIVSRLNLELTWVSLFGERLGSFYPLRWYPDSVATRLVEATEIVNSCILRTDMTESIWKKIKTPTYKKLEKSLNFIQSVLEEQLNKKVVTINDRKRTELDQHVSFIENYLHSLEVDLKDIRGMISDLILGGIDTTSYTACFLLYHLSNNKLAQQLLKEEALRLLPTIDSPITSTVLNDAIVTRAVLKETFRLNPVATGISRILEKDAILSGYIVPKGTLVVTHNLVACRLERYFKDANKFLPQRWIRGTKEYCNVTPYLVLPFSHGPRTCIARRLAEQNLLTFILKVGRNYSLDWHGDHLDITTPLICKPDKRVSLSFKRSM